MLRIAVLVSGRGRNLRAILESAQSHRIQASIEVVWSSSSSAPACEIAKAFDIPLFTKDPERFSRADYDRLILETLAKFPIDLVVLAGYQRLLTPLFLQTYPWRVINIHPALLPSFPGMHAQRQAIEGGAKIAGCTVHFVDDGVDTGPIIAQRALPILEEDTPETLSERLILLEQKLLPFVVGLFAEDRVLLNEKERRVTIKEKPNHA